MEGLERRGNLNGGMIGREGREGGGMEGRRDGGGITGREEMEGKRESEGTECGHAWWDEREGRKEGRDKVGLREGLERRGNTNGGRDDREGREGGRDGREKRWREKKGIRGRDEREGGKGELFEGG